jgi:hypothetical protein
MEKPRAHTNTHNQENNPLNFPHPTEFMDRLLSIDAKLADLQVDSITDISSEITIFKDDTTAVLNRQSITPIPNGTIKIDQSFTIQKDTNSTIPEYSSSITSVIDHHPLEVKEDVTHHPPITNHTESTNTPYAASQIGLAILLAEKLLEEKGEK